MLRNIKRISENAADMERHLGRRYNIQPSVCIHICICTKCFHHRLLICFCMVYPIDHMVARCKDCIYNRFRSSGDDCDRISYEPDSLIKNKPVVRTWLRICLTCQRETFIRTVFICKHTFNSRERLRTCSINLFDQRMSMRASYKLYD